MDIVTHYHIWLCIIVSLSIHHLWSWTCDFDTETIVFVYSQLVWKLSFQKLYSYSLPHNDVQHDIFKHPGPLCYEFDLGMFVIVQFWAYIKASIVKMDRVTHFHIKLCINFDSVLWPWHWKACPCQLSVINARILKMDIATLPHNVVQQGNLKHSYSLEHLHVKLCMYKYATSIEAMKLRLSGLWPIFYLHYCIQYAILIVFFILLNLSTNTHA